jgi:hypothetical protein
VRIACVHRISPSTRIYEKTDPLKSGLSHSKLSEKLRRPPSIAVNMAAEKSPEQIEITLSPLQKNLTNNQTTPKLKSCPS